MTSKRKEETKEFKEEPVFLKEKPEELGIWLVINLGL